MRSRTWLNIVPVFAVVLWIVTPVAPTLKAQDSTPSKPNFAVLTDDSLKQMLDNMGYEPKKLGKGFLLGIKRDSWTYYIQLVLSSDRNKLGFNSNLGIVENPDSVT